MPAAHDLRPESFGAVGDRNHDDYPAFAACQAAAAALIAGGSHARILLGPGFYRLVAPSPGWAITESMAIVGAGSRETILEVEAASGVDPAAVGGVLTTPGVSLGVERLTLQGPSGAPAQNAIFHAGGSASTLLRLRDVRVPSGWIVGVKLDDARDAQSVPQLRAGHCDADDCEIWGRDAAVKHNQGRDEAPRSYWFNCRGGSTGESQTQGWYVHRGVELRMVGCTIERASVDGLHLLSPPDMPLARVELRWCVFGKGCGNAILCTSGPMFVTDCLLRSAVNLMGAARFSRCVWDRDEPIDYDAFTTDPNAAPTFELCRFASAAARAAVRRDCVSSQPFRFDRCTFAGPSQHYHFEQTSGPVDFFDCRHESYTNAALIESAGGRVRFVGGYSETLRKLQVRSDIAPAELLLEGFDFRTASADLAYLLSAVGADVPVRGRVRSLVGSRRAEVTM